MSCCALSSVVGSQSESLHREAYNAVFREFEVDYNWSPEYYDELQNKVCFQPVLRIRSHLADVTERTRSYSTAQFGTRPPGVSLAVGRPESVSVLALMAIARVRCMSTVKNPQSFDECLVQLVFLVDRWQM